MSLGNTGGDLVQLKPDQINSNQIKSTTIVLSTCYFCVATPTTTVVWKSVYQV